MALGLHRAGIRAAALVEYDPAACLTLAAAVERGDLCGDVICDDANTVDLSEFVGADLVCGGPPCQPFSSAGSQGGEDDARDGWPAFVRAVRIVRPRFLLGENVRGFLFPKHGAYRARICSDLEALGYRLRVGLLNAADFGVPQTRQRVFIMGAREGETLPHWPEKTHHDPKLGASLFGSTVPWISAGEAIGIGALETLGGNPSARDIAAQGTRWGDHVEPPWKTGPADTVKIDGWSHQCRLLPAAPAWSRRDADPHTYNATSATRLADARPAATVIAHHTTGIDNIVQIDGDPFRAPWQWRAAWQSFPASWTWAHANQAQRDRQIGNAVPPPLAEALGRAIVGAG